MNLDGAHVLITGGSRGIGAAMARSFAAAGASISLASRSEADLHEVAGPLGASVFAVDLADSEETEELVGRVEATAGTVDVLMNNAGIEVTSHMHSADPAALRKLMRVNLEAPMVLTRQVLPGMLARNRGHLGYVSSLAATSGFPGQAAYGASKAGLTNFVAALRLELRDTDLHTTLVSPGPIDTEMWANVESNEQLKPVVKRLARLQLLPRKSPEYLADRVVAAVASDTRHVRTPRRLSANYWLRETPARMVEVLLKGADVGPKAG